MYYYIMKNILVIGCSFSHRIECDNGPTDNSWVDWLREEYKNKLIEELENHDCDIKAYNPEGWVIYSNKDKKFGNIKLVPRHSWTP